MRPDPLGQAVIDRSDFQLGLQDFEAALNVCQRFVALDDGFRHQVFHVGDHQQFAV